MEKINLRFNAGVEYKGIVYASAIQINGLFSLDLNTGEVRYIKSFSKEKPCYAIHRTAFLYQNEAWFIPQQGQYIAIVNLDTFEIDYMHPVFHRTNKSAVSKTNAVYYSGDIIEKQFLYLVPTNVDAMLLIDMERRKIYPYYNISTEEEYFVFGAYAKGSVYLWSHWKNTLMEIDLKTNKRRRYSLNYSMGAFSDLVFCRNKLWFCPFQSDLFIIFDLCTKQIEEVPIKELCDLKYVYEQIQILDEERLLFIPFQADKILELNINNKKIAEIYLESELLENGQNGFTKIYSQNNVVWASYYRNLVLIYNMERKEFQKFNLRIDREALLKNIEQIHERSGLEMIDEELYIQNDCYREDFWGIEKYFELIGESNFLSEKNQNKNGEFLWNAVR